MNELPGLVGKIKQVTEEMGFRFLYGSPESLNNLIDEQCPCVYLARIYNSYLDSGNAEAANVIIFFVNLTDFEYDSLENEAIIQQCKNVALYWASNINKGNILKQERNTNPRVSRVYEKFDRWVTGWGMDVRIIEHEPTECIEAPEFNTFDLTFDNTFQNDLGVWLGNK